MGWTTNLRELHTHIPASNERAFWESINPALPEFIEQQRWYASKTVGVSTAKLSSTLAVADDMALAIVDVTNNDQTTEQYSMALAHAVDQSVSEICMLVLDGVSVRVAEASSDARVWKRLLQTVVSNSEYCVTSSPAAQAWTPKEIDSWQVKIHGGEQSNTSIELGTGYFLKLFRKVVGGINPDVEVGRFLSEQSSFRNSPAVVQTLELTPSSADPACLLMVSERVTCVSDAWMFSLDRLDEFWQRVLSHSEADSTIELETIGWRLDSLSSPIDPRVLELIGEINDDAFLLGQRTCELHAAMQSQSDSAFTLEPTTATSVAQLVSGIQEEVRTTCEMMQHAELPIENVADVCLSVRDTSSWNARRIPTGQLRVRTPTVSSSWRLPSGASSTNGRRFGHHRFRR